MNSPQDLLGHSTGARMAQLYVSQMRFIRAIERCEGCKEEAQKRPVILYRKNCYLCLV